MTSPADLYRTLDQLIERFATGCEAAVVQEARRRFEDARGRVFEDEELWEPTSRCFVEWFVLEDAAPSRKVRAAAALEDVSGVDPKCARAWLRSHRSLFHVDAVGERSVDLSDLLGAAQFRVRDERGVVGIGVGDVIEARLAAVDDSVTFGRGFVFHPSEALSAMTNHIASMRAKGVARLAIVDFFASLRVQCERYRHVSAVRLYQNGGSPATAR